MKSICILTTVHRHDDVRIYHRQALSLAKAGYRVTLCCPDYEGKDEYGVRFHRLELPGGRFGRMWKASPTALKAALAEEYDLYHIHDPELLPAALQLKKRGKRVIYDAHEDVPRQILGKDWLPEWSRKPLSRRFERYEQKAARRLDGVIGATEIIAGRFPGGVAVQNFPDPQEFFPQGPPPYEKRRRAAVYAGSITQLRGIHQMVKAAGQAGVPLILAGEFENPALRHDITLLPGFDQVEERGKLSRDGVAKAMGEARMGLVVLFPTQSYQESLPIKLFEYMLCGLPVIASDFPLWRELTGKSCALFVDPQKVEEIAGAMTFLLENPDRAKAMGEAGRKLALKKYCWQSEEKRLLTLYRKLLEGEKA